MTIKHYFTSDEPQAIGEYIVEGVQALRAFNLAMGQRHEAGMVDVIVNIDGLPYVLKLEGTPLPADDAKDQANAH